MTMSPERGEGTNRSLALSCRRCSISLSFCECSLHAFVLAGEKVQGASASPAARLPREKIQSPRSLFPRWAFNFLLIHTLVAVELVHKNENMLQLRREIDNGIG